MPSPENPAQILIEFDGAQIRMKHPNDAMLCISMLSLALQEIYGKLKGHEPEKKNKIISLGLNIPKDIKA